MINAKSGRILINWMAVITYCSVIWILSSTRSSIPIPTFNQSDKLMHFGAFVVLAVLFWRAFAISVKAIKNPGLIILTLLSSVVFGAMIEVHQRFLPHRRAEAMDLVADILGCGIGILICLIFLRKKKV